ncbi:MAG TPA: hypothetical protein PKJ95_00550 [Atribacterota bacterium]|nr:hypothetical protein [Atribacterota bacterium]
MWIYESRKKGGKYKIKKTWEKKEQRKAESYFCLMKGRTWSCRLRFNDVVVKAYNAESGRIFPEPPKEEDVEQFEERVELVIPIKQWRIQKIGRSLCF